MYVLCAQAVGVAYLIWWVWLKYYLMHKKSTFSERIFSCYFYDKRLHLNTCVYGIIAMVFLFEKIENTESCTDQPIVAGAPTQRQLATMYTM